MNVFRSGDASTDLVLNPVLSKTFPVYYSVISAEFFQHSAQYKSSDIVRRRMFHRIEFFILCMCSRASSSFSSASTLSSGVTTTDYSSLSSSSVDEPRTPLQRIMSFGLNLTCIFPAASKPMQWFKISQSLLSTIFSNCISSFYISCKISSAFSFSIATKLPKSI